MDDQHISLLLLSDTELVKRVCQREVAAFAVLYDRYSRPIYILAAHMLDPAEAEEAVQEVFLRLWSKADQFQVHRGSFNTWFMSIARHHVLDRLRHLSQQRRFILASEVDQLFVEAIDPTMGVEEEVGQRDLGKMIIRAMEELPEEQRRALVLAYFSGLTQSVIAAHLGWPLGTVKKRIRLGLQKLRVALIDKGEEGEGQYSRDVHHPKKEDVKYHQNKSRGER